MEIGNNDNAPSDRIYKACTCLIANLGDMPDEYKRFIKSLGAIFSSAHEAYILPNESVDALSEYLDEKQFPFNTFSTWGAFPADEKAARVMGLETSLDIERVNNIKAGLPSENASTELKQQKIESLQKTSEKHAHTLSLIRQGEHGDAAMFMEIFPGKYLWDHEGTEKGSWYFWDGSGYWREDLGKQRHSDLDKVALTYEALAETASPEDAKELRKRRAAMGAKRCRDIMAKCEPHCLFTGPWDICPGHLPCANGIVDLRTGELRPVRREEHLRLYAPTEYIAGARSALWERFIDDITLGDVELAGFLQRLLGYAMTGCVQEQVVAILWGAEGANGKGTLMQTLENIVGPLALQASCSMLMVQRNQHSAESASPAIAALKGKRLAIYSEANQGQRFDEATMKNLSGCDTLVARRLYSSTVDNFKPTHTIFLQTNYKPRVSASDSAWWRRAIIVPFLATFVDTPDLPHQRLINRALKEQMAAERSGILSWLVGGSIAYFEHGLQIPESVKKVAEDYRRENNGIQSFLDDCCILAPELSVPKQKFIDALKAYCNANGMETPTRNDICKHMNSIFKEWRSKEIRSWVGLTIDSQ